MQTIVVGGGKVGYYLTKTLLEHGHKASLIEQDRAACARAANNLDITVICGDGSTIDVFDHPREAVTKDFIATATNINKIYDLIESGNPLTELKPGGKMLILSYSNTNTKEAVISQVSRKFNVDASIIFGNVEVLKDLPFGKLVVSVNGAPEDVEAAVAYFQSVGVDTEVIKG